MKHLKLIGLALGASLALSSAALAQDITVAVAGSDDRRRICVRPANEERRRTGDRRPQRRRRRAPEENWRCSLAMMPAIRSRRARWRKRSPVPRFRSWRGHYCSSSSIPASEAYADGNVLQITPASTNPLFTERKLWKRGARVRPRRPARPGRRRLHRQELQRQERRHPQRQDDVRQGPRRRDQEGTQQGRLHRKDVRVLPTRATRISPRSSRG